MITVKEQAEQALGVAFRVEGTGGGCEALTATLEGGMVVVLCDDNLGVDFGGMGVDYGVQIGVYAPNAWGETDDDALVSDYTLDMQGVGACVLSAVGAAASRMVEG